MYMDEKNPIGKTGKEYFNFPLVLLAVFVVFFSLADRSFATVQNITSIIYNNTYIFIFCIGYSFILTCGGLDFSAGMQISIVSTVAGVLGYMKVPWPTVLAVSLGSGLLCGAVNAFIIARMRVPYAFATLSTYIAFYGISHIISQGKAYWISPDSFRSIIIGDFLFVPVDVWLLIFGLIALEVIFNRTYLGSHIIAVGENAQAAAASGVSVRNTKNLSIILGSLFFSVAALVYISKKGSSNPVDGIDFFQITGFPGAYLAVTAAGKRGRIKKGMLLPVRFFLGVCVILVLDNGLKLLEWSAELECVITALVLILATSQDYRHSHGFDRAHEGTLTHVFARTHEGMQKE